MCFAKTVPPLVFVSVEHVNPAHPPRVLLIERRRSAGENPHYGILSPRGVISDQDLRMMGVESPAM